MIYVIFVQCMKHKMQIMQERLEYYSPLFTRKMVAIIEQHKRQTHENVQTQKHTNIVQRAFDLMTNSVKFMQQTMSPLSEGEGSVCS